MKQESEGKERLVLCCGDGDVVDVGKGDGGGVGERGKESQEKCEFANVSKRVISARAV